MLDGASITDKKKLQVQQNTALRAVCNIDYSYQTTKLYTTVGVDTVETSMMKTTCNLVYKGMYGIGPNVLNEMFMLYEPTCNLRSSNTLACEVPRTYTQFGVKNVVVRGPKYWNMLPYNIKSSSTESIFKERIKKYTGFDKML